MNIYSASSSYVVKIPHAEMVLNNLDQDGQSPFNKSEMTQSDLLPKTMNGLASRYACIALYLPSIGFKAMLK